MDAFAVSLGVGTSPISYSTRSKVRLAFHFGVFQAGMTLFGWLGGTTIEQLILLAIGWRILLEISSFREGNFFKKIASELLESKFIAF